MILLNLFFEDQNYFIHFHEENVRFRIDGIKTDVFRNSLPAGNLVYYATEICFEPKHILLHFSHSQLGKKHIKKYVALVVGPLRLYGG